MTSHEMLETLVVDSPEAAVVLLNPLRAGIAARLIEPASAAEIARQISETPQRINYHLKALEKAGLVRRVGTRQVRNLVEVLYQAVAKTFILSEQLGLKPDTVRRLKDQGSLAHLIRTAKKMKQDALELMEASDEGTEIPSAVLEFSVRLKDEAERQAFIEDYAAMVRELTAKYRSRNREADSSYHVMLAVYPQSTPSTPRGGNP